jgi:hypothetical protein
MIQVQSNILAKLQALQDAITSCTSPQAIARSCHDALAATRDILSARIHTQGLATDGTAIGTYKDKNRLGNVTLTGTGALRDALGTIETASGACIAWTDPDMATRAAMIEQRYGKPIWSLSDAERRQLLLTLQKNISHVLTRKTN